jgi:hypothetical protein
MLFVQFFTRQYRCGVEDETTGYFRVEFRTGVPGISPKLERELAYMRVPHYQPTHALFPTFACLLATWGDEGKHRITQCANDLQSYYSDVGH